MMADAGYTANEGTPEQLPRGAAEALNENVNVVPPDELEVQPVADAPGEETEEEEPLDPEDEDGIKPAAAADYTPLYEPASEDESLILGPSTRPDESETAGTAPASPISRRLRLLTPVIQKAAEEPGASPQLKELLEYILRNS
jgi:hypothetical protein